MPSRLLPIEELEHLETKFWLPAGGRENGVDATTWAVLAELEGDEVSPVLSKLAAANVAGRVVTIAGAAALRGDARHRLYVDAMRYNEALDALMLALRGKDNRELSDYVPRRRPSKSPSPNTTPARRQLAQIALRVGQWILIAATFALMLGIGYATASHRFPVVHSRPLHEHAEPGIHQPSTRHFP
jgi:hypothetical protein